jgi:hypothetical protein
MEVAAAVAAIITSIATVAPLVSKQSNLNKIVDLANVIFPQNLGSKLVF